MKFNILSNNGHLSYSIIEDQLKNEFLRRHILDDKGISIRAGHLGMTPCDILITTWETSKIPSHWHLLAKHHKLIVVGSAWNLLLFKNAGIKNVICIPFGICDDFLDRNTFTQKNRNDFLFFANNQLRKGLDVLELIWLNHYKSFNKSLKIVGRNIKLSRLNASKSEKIDKFIVTYYHENAVLYEPTTKLSTDEIRDIYQESHTLVLPSRSEGFGLTVLEALCCGTNVVMPSYSSTAEFSYENSFKFDGIEVTDNGAECGYGFNGNWWVPETNSLLECLQSSIECGLIDFERHRKQLELIKNMYSWQSFVDSLIVACRNGESNNSDDYNKYNTPLGVQRIYIEKIKFKVRRAIYS